MVFNGNGRSGAAGTDGGPAHSLGYKIAGTANARRQDYATSVVMYGPGFRAEGMRLAQGSRREGRRRRSTGSRRGARTAASSPSIVGA